MMARISAALVAVFLCVGVAWSHHNELHTWMLTWIPGSCCVTNDCCWEIAAREVRSLPGDRWEVLATGQVLKRTDYSPDGKFYRCACDYDGKTGQWNKHDKANTRCLFIGFSGS